jgi:hypothetical protein
MDEAERALFTDTIRQLTVERRDDELDAALDELGWAEALVEQRPVAIAVLFEALGEANATSSALDQVLVAALGVPIHTAVALPPVRQVEPPGQRAGGRVIVRGLGTRTLAHSESVVVVTRDDTGDRAFVVPASMLKAEPVTGLDPALGLSVLSAELDVASLPTPAEVQWSAATTAGQLALAHELVGAGRGMLELARTHALERIQFGRPIASFQAVRHRLAESLVALEASAALLSAAWDEPSGEGAAMAKGLAGRSARTVARHCQQVLAGIGFTAEHPFHHFFRRTVVLDQLLGASSVLTRQLGSDVLATGALPATYPL